MAFRPLGGGSRRIGTSSEFGPTAPRLNASTPSGDLPIPDPMRNFLRPPTEAERRARYPVRVLESPRLEAAGIAHGPASARELLSWGRVERVVVAEVGEPEGVRTIVCDLVTRGERIAVHRLDAEPGEAAIALARGLEAGIGSARAPVSLKSVAADGLATSWFPDLRTFEEAALEELDGGG